MRFFFFFGVCVYVVYEDTHLYNDMAMTYKKVIY